MQKKRMSLERARRKRKTIRWWQQYGNYIAVVGIFFVIVTVVILAVSLNIKGKMQIGEATDASSSTDIATVNAETEKALKERQTTQESIIASRDWDATDTEILLKVAMAEAEGESIEGKAVVMLVVLNRTWSKDFPNSIEAVVFQDTPRRQFAVTEEGGRYWTTTPNEDCVKTLELVESGWDESWGAMYFESDKSGTSWHSRNLEFLFQLGNHRFYK